MRIALYSPYLPKHRGGGEKYLLDVAADLLAKKHQVYLGISQDLSADQKKHLLAELGQFTGQDLTALQLVFCPLNTSASWWQKLIWTAGFDGLYYQTDGSLFLSLAKKNILHIQVPFTLPKKRLWEKLKLASWSVKNTNSGFTKSVIEKSWQTKIDFVHYPKISPIMPNLSADFLAQKQPIILHVGRFFKQLHCKHQEVLVQAFRKLTEQDSKLVKGWQLVFVGSIEDQIYADQIHQAAQGLPIKFVHEAAREDLLKLYKSASIYWHATGFGHSEITEPEKMEHFGISTVEAMSAGAAPVVINKGGQAEIMTGELRIWTWNELTELLSKTAKLIQEPKLLAQVQKLAHARSLDFNQANFSNILDQMIK